MDSEIAERRTIPGYEYHSCDFMEDGIYIDMNRLREYEDTGLTTQEILGLKERDTAKELVQYGDEDEPVLRCPHCDEDVTDLTECGFNFCPYCGQKLK